MQRFLSFLVLAFLSACTPLVPNKNVREDVVNIEGKAIVLDAGSSGTRVFVYDWHAPSGENNYPSVRLPNGRIQKISPALHEVPTDRVREYLTPLLNFAKTIVPKNELSSTPLFFAGTAGLRLLQQRKPKTFAELMTQTKDVLNDSGFRVLRNASPISGEEEAAFAWVAVNALENRLSKTLYGQASDTIGIVEMGGASFQMAFLPRESPSQQKFTITLAGKELDLYAHSYGELGENEARQQFSDARFCEWGKTQPNYYRCKDATLEKLRRRLGKECGECGIGTIYQPPYGELSPNFYALGTLSHLEANYGLSIINAANLSKIGHLVCSISLEKARTSILMKLPQDSQEKACFTIAYYSSVLSGDLKNDQNGIGFPADSVALTPKALVNGVEPSWTYGFLLLSLDALFFSNAQTHRLP